MWNYNILVYCLKNKYVYVNEFVFSLICLFYLLSLYSTDIWSHIVWYIRDHHSITKDFSVQ